MNATSRETISPTRTKATWKPGVFNEPIAFYRCATCGTIFAGVDGGTGPCLIGGGRQPIAELPYTPATSKLSCCGVPMERLPEQSSDKVVSRIALSYEVVGGFNTNALRVYWTTSHKEDTPRWFALKTFTGLQLKYVIPGKKPPLVFAFADEDAYAYCDEDPCLSCTFHCKRGFVLYAYLKDCGLVSLPLHCEDISH